MTDSKLQRLNMVESQVRTSDVTDRRIIKAMLEVPRERFVPAEYASMAYMDDPVPVGPSNGAKPRLLLAPRTLAKLAQLAEIGAEETVLDVGCATGYSTAILAQLAKRVVAVEVDADLAATARRLLAELGVANATVVEAPLAAGVPGQSRFGAIFVNGAVEVVAPALLEQLEEGGRLVAVVAKGALSRAEVWRRSGKSCDARAAFEAGAALLPGFERPPAFVF
jgi:protein-L-isoaspartate(D-aspartate) O-methyltransferase